MRNRRDFSCSAIGSAAALSLAGLPEGLAEEANAAYQPNYMLASCMYGYLYLGEILPEVRKIGATAIDLWPKVHGNQREQIDDLGHEKFRQMLDERGVRLGCITQYPLGPFGLQPEIELAAKFDCPTIVTGGAGPRDLTGEELKQAVRAFCRKMQPHAAKAAEAGVTIAIENHGNNLIDSPDSLKWLAEFAPEHLGIALAPYHLPQDTELLSDLIGQLDEKLALFYAWQHGNGSMQAQPKEDELLQLPGRGELDFCPLLAALKKIEFAGWTEIFMHPYPRGVPIMQTVGEVTAEINRAREYLSQCG